MYKVMENNMVIDLLPSISYIRFLPKQKRAVLTDSQTANGIIASDGNIFYHLCGRPNTFINNEKSVTIVEIGEEEYNILQNQQAMRDKENADLRNKINSLEEQIAKQNLLLEQLLAKL